MKILIIEDEKALSEAVCHALRKENIASEARYDGESGLDEALTSAYDAIILDVMLPMIDGFEILRSLRADGIHTPVVMLTARSDLGSRVEGLDTGADYYLTKPFEMQELLACLRAVVRRPEVMREEEPTFGDAVVQSRLGGIKCKKTGKFVKMGIKELHLFELLVANGGGIVSKETLIEKIWGFESDAEYNNIEVYVSFVRKKLAFIGSNVTIKATRGIGYSLEYKEG